MAVRIAYSLTRYGMIGPCVESHAERRSAGVQREQSKFFKSRTSSGRGFDIALDLIYRTNHPSYALSPKHAVGGRVTVYMVQNLTFAARGTSATCNAMRKVHANHSDHRFGAITDR